MLSRVAESIYWMSRHVERADNLARFIEVHHNLALDLPQATDEQWQPLVSITGDEALFAKRYGPATRASVLQFLAFDADYPHSIVSCFSQARACARSVRETISAETWEQLNEFQGFVAQAAAQPPGERPDDLFERVRLAGHLFQGIIDSTMSHNEGWHFARLGRMLERADKTSRILDVKYFLLLPQVQDVGGPLDDLQWSAVLKSVSAFAMYRRRHHGITPPRVVEFLLLDREFPRAVRHCLNAADQSLRAISGTPRDTFHNPAEQRLGQLQSELAFASVDEIVDRGLHEFIDGLQLKLNQVNDAIEQVFFALRPVDDLAARPSVQNGALRAD
ncbi:MAG: alpha-E domain-containing protein [Proteobacteria bacterium]|nr:alpha-E domain-containing protein [Pseudomonadota bacterium]